MAADDVAAALMAMDEEGLRAAVAGGDYARLAHFDLSDDEKALLQRAAGEGDVVGFFVCNELALMQCDDNPGGSFGVAVGYANAGISLKIAPTFQTWTAIKNAQGGW